MFRQVLTAAAWFMLSMHIPRAQNFCHTTLPPSQPFIPPAPYVQDSGDDRFWYGTEALWTSLRYDGKWTGYHNERGYREKLFFWAKGYDWRKEPKPPLIINVHRLDADGRDIAITDANNAFVPSRGSAGMVTAFEIPTPGCWQLTAHFHGHTLTFVVLVG